MRQLQENETDMKTHIMEAGGLTCRGGRHNRRTLERTHRFTYKYKQQNCTSGTYNASDGIRHAAMASSVDSPEVFNACIQHAEEQTAFALQIVADGEMKKVQQKILHVTTRHKVSACIILL